MGEDFLILAFGRTVFAVREALFRRTRDILQIIWHVRFEVARGSGVTGVIRCRTTCVRSRFFLFVRLPDLNRV